MESPAQRLGLAGEPRAHAEKCLSEAIYFEARGEPYQGQEAVAQVVMNRVFSGYYPHDVCGVVFQNKNHHLACQFTFACEGKDLSQIDEPDMWEQAKEIAKKMLDGKIWLADIGHATHYHAYWVHPSWVHEMVRLYKLGVHTFYRPRAWGDDEPTWSPAAVKDETQADKPQAAAIPAAALPPRLRRQVRRRRPRVRKPPRLPRPPRRSPRRRRSCNRHCEERSDEAIQAAHPSAGLLRHCVPRNDGSGHISISSPTSRLVTEWVSAPDDR